MQHILLVWHLQVLSSTDFSAVRSV